jgi:hypothetical protein
MHYLPLREFSDGVAPLRAVLGRKTLEKIAGTEGVLRPGVALLAATVRRFSSPRAGAGTPPVTAKLTFFFGVGTLRTTATLVGRPKGRCKPDLIFFVSNHANREEATGKVGRSGTTLESLILILRLGCLRGANNHAGRRKLRHLPLKRGLRHRRSHLDFHKGLIEAGSHT